MKLTREKHLINNINLYILDLYILDIYQVKIAKENCLISRSSSLLYSNF